MSVLTPLDPQAVAARIKAGQATLVDIREPKEHAQEHIPDAVLVPLSRLEAGGLTLETHGDVIFHCKSGGRTAQNCDRLAAHVDGQAYVLDGGIEAWKRAGLTVASGTPAATAPASAPVPAAAPPAETSVHVERQVRFVAGAIALVGALLAWKVHPGFLIIPGFIGAALTFAGLTGFCTMEKLLAAAPWNVKPNAKSNPGPSA
jgi:rhodanese-related sulfurtransferase